MTQLIFEFRAAWLWALPLVLAILIGYGWSLYRWGLPYSQLVVLLILRGATLALILVLIGRPTWTEPEEKDSPRREVVLLMDRSESMSLEDGARSRYRQAVDFARDQLLPDLARDNLPAAAVLFAEDARSADGEQLARALPNGQQTDLAGAIVEAVNGREPPPLAIVALTDGVATRNEQNQRAMIALVQNRIPFLGVGFGTESGSRVISLERVAVPPAVFVMQQFPISIQLRALGSQQLPAFELVLLRNGRLVKQKRVGPIQAPRIWQESFTISEEDEGHANYTVQLLPPADPGLVCANSELAASVRVTAERTLRVLFVQGGLTWDYKFLRLAAEGDPTIQVAGLSRTASNSVFFQTVQDDGELVGGFPTSLDKLARHRVVVLSHLGPQDLTPQQQQLLDQYCGHHGGGVLLLGGSTTFHADWRGSPLQKLLPVVMASSLRSRDGDTIRPRPTAAALRHPVFQIGDERTSAAVWSSLPVFSNYARVDEIKPGAEVWLEGESGARQRAPLMVVQRYGTGLTAAICIEDFWRWRLAKNTNTAQFDRFWVQLLRFLATGNRQLVTLLLPDQALQPNSDIRIVLESRPDPQRSATAPVSYTVQVVDQQQRTVSRQIVNLAPDRSAEMTFRASEPGLHTITVSDGRNMLQTTRSIDIRAISGEFVAPSRNMENLRQWAKLSNGLAVKAEECDSTLDLLKTIQDSTSAVRQKRVRTMPAAINGWTLTLLLSCICAEWILRKRWELS